MAAPTKYGILAEYQPDIESIEVYEDRVRVFLVANEIPEERQVAVLLSVIGAPHFSLLSSLLAPEKPSDKTVDELLDVLRAHFSKKRVTIAERYRFYSRVQRPGETAIQFAAELRQLAVHCKFEGFLDQALRDRFVCGLRDTVTQRKLLSGEDLPERLSFKAAVEIAVTLETVATGVKDLGRENVYYNQQPEPRCHRCGRDGHRPIECRFRGAICRKCGKKGHLQAVCRSRENNNAAPLEHKRKGTQKAPVRKIDEPTDESSVNGDEDDEVPGCFKVTVNSVKATPPPIKVTVKLEGQPVVMEVDTGATVSIISECTYRKWLNDTPLCPAEIQLQTYTSEPLTTLGRCSVTLQYGAQRAQGTLYVVSGEGPSLLGRDVLQKIKLNWPKIMRQVHNIAGEGPQQLGALLKKYEAVLQDKLGTFKGYHATLHLRENTTPRYFRPRVVPFALREAVERELDRLVKQEILEPVRTSEWATPIVVVPKKEGNIRICGDYKVTVNPALAVDIHPIPKPQELFASLAGGEKFTKLDLSQAYQQLLLDEKSKELMTINTHKGLFRYTRLPFGVASAPAIFQRTMDSILQGIPRVCCYIDDILISG